MCDYVCVCVLHPRGLGLLEDCFGASYGVDVGSCPVVPFLSRRGFTLSLPMVLAVVVVVAMC